MEKFYEKPVAEVLKMQSENCILEGSAAGLEDYNNPGWDW